MLRLFPSLMPAFAPAAEYQMDFLSEGVKQRSRSMLQSLVPIFCNGDPLPDPFPELTQQLPEPEQQPPPPTREPHLPTPTDVPVPAPTDVPAPEPWDVPPPDPSDPQPQRIP